MALDCLLVGGVISLLLDADEPSAFWLLLKSLLSYQGFVLLPILGVGGYLLPRFLGLPNRQDFPTSRDLPPGWLAKAGEALVVGTVIIVSFVIEALGWYRSGAGLRLVAAAAYLLREVPFYRSTGPANALSSSLKLALTLMLCGYLATLVFPVYRMALLHFTLMGGFSVVVLVVSTRVVFGHSGNKALLAQRNRWLRVSVGLIVLAMVTRVSADLWPSIMKSHFIYGAVTWAAGALLWAYYVLPKVRDPDPEE